jgi:4-hydroxybenzoate polyprenyltransferase
MLDWLRLIRASGLFTIASNLAAAAFVATYATGSLDLKVIAGLIGQGNRLAAVWVVVTSCLLYASGMLWNDLADIERDRQLHPRRPLPSGRIGITAGFVVGALCAVGALLVSLLITPLSDTSYGFITAGLVLSLALLYDFVTKSVPWLGSLNMALVRTSHALFALLLLGVDHFKLAGLAVLGVFGVHAAAPVPLGLAVYPLLLGLYIFGVTLISELESRPGRRWELVLGGALMATAMAAAVLRLMTAHWISGLQQTGGYVQLVASIFLGLGIALLWGWRVLGAWLGALRAGRKGLVGPVVGQALAGMILFDALMATSAHPLGGLAILCLYPCIRVVGRAIRMD